MTYNESLGVIPPQAMVVGFVLDLELILSLDWEVDFFQVLGLILTLVWEVGVYQALDLKLALAWEVGFVYNIRFPNGNKNPMSTVQVLFSYLFLLQDMKMFLYELDGS